MKNIFEIIKDSFVSALIGIAVGSFYQLVILTKFVGKEDVILSTVLSGGIGILIGLSARFVFILLKKGIINSAKTAYVIESFLIVILTFIFSYMMGVREIKYLIIMSIIALSLALWFSYKSCATNEKLKKFQEKIIRNS